MRQTWVGAILFLTIASCAAKGASTGFEQAVADAGADTSAPGVVNIKNISYSVGSSGLGGWGGAIGKISFLVSNDTDSDVSETRTLELVAGGFDGSGVFDVGSCMRLIDPWTPKAHTSALVTLNAMSQGAAGFDWQCAPTDYPNLVSTFNFSSNTYPDPMFKDTLTVTLAGLFKDGSAWHATAMGDRL